jgi:putative tricarboxylic transport membrane protein
MHQALADLSFGFSVALQPNNLMWSILGVLVGNLIGVLPGLGVMTTISMLLPLTYMIDPLPAVLMLAGIFYGSQYGGAIGAILLNLPSHPPHAVTCLDGYPMTLQGKGGTALGITMLASFFAASTGILVMIFLSPLLVQIAFKFGPTEIFAIMLLGLLAGATMSRGSALKGVAMTVFGLICGVAGTDVTSGAQRFTFGLPELSDGLDLTALCMGLFGIAHFLVSVNRVITHSRHAKVKMSDMRPSWKELKQAFPPILRGTAVGTLFGALPGTGPTITTFVSYALERKLSKTPERFGKGALEGVAAPEASSHAKTQVDFIPTMSLGIPGDAVMALILGALIVKGVQPGPQLISEHPDIFWGLIASFWIGNLLLVILNVPMIGVWVRMLQIPYRLLFPAAVYFICIGVFSIQSTHFQVAGAAVFGVLGAIFLMLDFPLSPIILGFVLGPMVEENFRRALLLSRGDLTIFLTRPISAMFIVACALLVLAQVLSYGRRLHSARKSQAVTLG